MFFLIHNIPSEASHGCLLAITHLNAKQMETPIIKIKTI